MSTELIWKAFTTVRGPGVGEGAIETLGELLHMSRLSDWELLLPDPELPVPDVELLLEVESMLPEPDAKLPRLFVESDRELTLDE